MRREAMKHNEVDIKRVELYHHGDYSKKLIFASDRPSPATGDYRLEADNSLPAMYGIEIETQCWGVTSQTTYANILSYVCFQDFHKDLFKIEDDCSLHNPGVDSAAECITQPMTRAYIRNNYRNFKSMFEYFRAFGIDPAKTGDCGQHCHISLTCFGRTKITQDEAIRKFFYIVNKHFDLICALLYRRTDRQEYCSRMDYTRAWTMNLEHMSGSHGNSFNGAHYGSGNIELRVPGGQKDFPCFRNTMESIFHLVDICKTISRKDCDDVTKIFSGCNNYVYDRLRSYCLERGTITHEQLATIRQSLKMVQYI